MITIEKISKSIIDTDFPDFIPVTQETIETTKRLSNKFRGSVRYATGRIWETKKYEEYRKKVIETPLP